MNILMIGCGSMGGALAGAWATRHHVLAFDPVAQLPLGVRRITELDAAVMPGEWLIVIAVKPQIFAQVAPAIAPLVGPARTFVSIMAGVPVAMLRASLGDAAVVLRSMPNTPAAVGAGVTGVFSPADIDLEVRSAVSALFDAVGEVIWIEEEAQFDAVTAVSGSGPAYFLRFAEALAEAGVSAGLSRDVAMRLARGTLKGTGALVDGDLATLDAQRERVTSPGGTTAAGLAAMEGDVDALVVAAVSAAARRSAELTTMIEGKDRVLRRDGKPAEPGRDLPADGCCSPAPSGSLRTSGSHSV